MPPEITLKTVLYFLSICMALGRPHFPLISSDLSFPSSGLNSHSHGFKVPPYMMHLYQALTGKNKPDKPKYHILEEADTVQSLPAKSFTVEDNRWSVTFDFTAVSKEDDLRLVELRVLLPPFQTSTNIILEIFHTGNGQKGELLGSIIENMPVSHYSAWKSFNVTNMMEQYLHWGKKMDNHEDKSVKKKPHSVTVSDSEDPKMPMRDYVRPQKPSTNQAIIVFFSKDTPSTKPLPSGLIRKLSKNLAKSRFRRQRRNRNKRQISPNNKYSIAEAEQAPLCRKVDMMVDFKMLGWDNLVIYPKKYNAYRCEGSCRNPLRNTNKTTNYDYIKSSVNLNEWEREECSLCVPVKMQPLPIILHEESTFVFKHYNDMIIEECGVL